MTQPHLDTAPWWRQAVTYQIYIRSFADGNGDGTGDIAGLRSRLPYLRDLGVDAVWINPWYTSPLLDGGYDVADYRNIDPRYGTLDEAAALIEEAHELGLRVVGDLVPNHTSIEHAWFRDAVAAPSGHPSRDRYHFRAGRGPDGAEPPNNWQSVFGDVAWTRAPDGDWYLHLFDSSQPDLNWAHPEVRADFLDILRFWFDRGIDGFRVDVAHGLAKDPELPDLDPSISAFPTGDVGHHPYWDRDEVHDIIRTWREVADTYADRVLVAEAWVAPHRLPNYLAADQYHQSFNFDFLVAPWEASGRRAVIEQSLAVLDAHDAMPTWVLSNHDVVRHATRFALPDSPRILMAGGDIDAHDAALGLRRARAAALMMLALPGSVYLYQGEELGLPEVTDLPDDVLDDPVWERSGRTLRGRDGCRVPVPWTDAGPSYGFGDGASWLPQPSVFGSLAVDAQDGVPGSTLELYRTALRLRRSHLAEDRSFAWHESGDDVLDFERSSVRCIVNMGTVSVSCPPGDVLLASAPVADGQLPPDTAVWLATGSGRVTDR